MRRPPPTMRSNALFFAVCAFLLAPSISKADKTLYTPDDHVLILDIENFNDKLYNQNRAFFVEFYSSYCGACISYAPKFKTFAKDVMDWKDTVEVTVVNCADEKNSPLCREHGIDSFPTLKYFKYQSKTKDDGVKFEGDKHDIINLPGNLAQLVYDDYMQQKPAEWPKFAPIHSTATVKDLWSSFPTEFLVIVFEKMPAKTAWSLMIDFASEKRVRIFNAAEDHPLLNTLNDASKSFPKLVVYKNNLDSADYVAREAGDYYGMLTKIEQYLNGAVPDAERQEPVVNAVDSPKAQPADSLLQGNEIDPFKVQLLDLTAALTYMTEHEIPRKQRIIGEDFTALKSFIHLLSKYVPGTNPIRRLFYRLDQWLTTEVASDSIASEQWLAKLEKVQDELGHPLAANSTYSSCRGSKPHLRGYTCGLWTLFHGVTAQAYKQDGANADFKPVAVLEPIRQFVKHFLSCEECSKHFDQMANERRLSAVVAPQEVVLWLWRAHNEVNERLKGAASEDPSFPKQQFPPPSLCPSCRSGSSWDEKVVLDFLTKHYTNVYTDSAKSGSYKVSDFDKGHRADADKKLNLNPRFAGVGQRVERMEETERRLQQEKTDLSPQRRWQAYDSERRLNEDGGGWLGWTGLDTTLCISLWLISSLFLICLFVYFKYRRNKSKFWKTFYYYNDYKV
uniref:Sulfhydryl oxidase n=1 Tax=Plectus sambesii TaxID=2011161 RepID=A0A914WWW1_9BILA